MLAGGVAPPSCDQPYTYMELGFGQGISLALLAAANPQAQFYGVDFMAEHVEHARGLGEAAGLNNVHLSQISFTDLDKQKFPEFDFIVLHGVWSWVSADLRADVLKFITAKLKPGGVVYVSYNAMPGWAAMEPLRELLKLEFDRAEGSLEACIKAALRRVREIEKAQPLFFRANPTIEIRLGQMESEGAAYLAHEYFNAEWKPWYFEDVAADFDKAGLTFAASANLHDNVTDLTIRPEGRALYAEMRTVLQRETLKDYLINKQFRRDIFVRGPRILPDGEFVALNAAARFAALMNPDDLNDAKLTTEAAALKLNSPVHRALVAGLANGARTVSELVAEPALAALNTNAAFGTLFLLTAMNAVEPAAAEVSPLSIERTQRLNQAILQRAATGNSIPAVASPLTGAGIELNAIDQLFLRAVMDSAEPVAAAAEAFKQSRQTPLRDGKPIAPGEVKKYLRERHALFVKSKLAACKRLGMVG